MHIAQRLDWIAQLPEAVRHEVRCRMSVTEVAHGELVSRAGEPANHIHQVVSGYVKLLQDLPNGRQVLLGIYIPGNCFSETAVICGRDYHHTTLAATAVTLNTLYKADFEYLYYTYPQIPQALCLKFGNLLGATLGFRESAALLPVRKQVVAVFVDLAKSCTSSTNPPWEIAVPVTVSEIADILSVSRQTVQKEVSNLKQRGLVAKSTGKWIVNERVMQENLES